MEVRITLLDTVLRVVVVQTTLHDTVFEDSRNCAEATENCAEATEDLFIALIIRA